MNHTYKLIWSDTRQTWVAVPEYASAKGKRASGSVLMLAVGSAVAQTPPAELLAQPVITGSETMAISYQDHNPDQLIFSADSAVDIELYSENTPLDPSLDSPLAEQVNLNAEPVLEAKNLAVTTVNQDQHTEDLVLLSQNISPRAAIPIIEFPTLTENLDYVPTDLQVKAGVDASQISNAEIVSLSSNKATETTTVNSTELEADLVVSSINLPPQPESIKAQNQQAKPLVTNSAPVAAEPVNLAAVSLPAQQTLVEPTVVGIETKAEIAVVPQLEVPVNPTAQVQPAGTTEVIAEKSAEDADLLDSVMQVVALPELLVNKTNMALTELDWLPTAEKSIEQAKNVEQTAVEPEVVALETSPALAVASGVEPAETTKLLTDTSAEDADFISSVKQLVEWPALIVDQAGSAVLSLALLPDFETENSQLLDNQPVKLASEQQLAEPKQSTLSQAMPADSKPESASVAVAEPDTDIDSYLLAREAEKRQALLEKTAELKLNSLNQSTPLYAHALLEEVLAETVASDEDKDLDIALKNMGDQQLPSGAVKVTQQPEASLQNQLLSNLFNDEQVGGNVDQDDLSIDSQNQVLNQPKSAELVSNGLGQQAAAFSDSAITGSANPSCHNPTKLACQVNVAVKQLPAVNSLGLIEVTIPKMAQRAKQGLNFELPESVWQKTTGGALTATTETGAKLPSWMRLETREGQAQIDLAKFPVRALPMTFLLSNGQQNWQLKIMPETQTSKAKG